jgi:hypothetical protein
VPRLLREKLSVCDLLTFLLNIVGRIYRVNRDYRQKPRVVRFHDFHPMLSFSVVVEIDELSMLAAWS